MLSPIGSLLTNYFNSSSPLSSSSRSHFLSLSLSSLCSFASFIQLSSSFFSPTHSSVFVYVHASMLRPSIQKDIVQYEGGGTERQRERNRDDSSNGRRRCEWEMVFHCPRWYTHVDTHTHIHLVFTYIVISSSCFTLSCLFFFFSLCLSIFSYPIVKHRPPAIYLHHQHISPLSLRPVVWRFEESDRHSIYAEDGLVVGEEVIWYE